MKLTFGETDLRLRAAARGILWYPRSSSVKLIRAMLRETSYCRWLGWRQRRVLVTVPVIAYNGSRAPRHLELHHHLMYQINLVKGEVERDAAERVQQVNRFHGAHRVALRWNGITSVNCSGQTTDR